MQSLSLLAISAMADRCPEDVRVLAIVVPEFEFRNVERQIFLADLVEGSDSARA